MEGVVAMLVGLVEGKWWGCASYFGGFVETWRWWLYW